MSNFDIGKFQNKNMFNFKGVKYDINSFDKLIGKSTQGSIFKCFDNASKLGNGNNIFDEKEVKNIKEHIMNLYNDDKNISHKDIETILNVKPENSEKTMSDLENLLYSLNYEELQLTDTSTKNYINVKSDAANKARIIKNQISGGSLNENTRDVLANKINNENVAYILEEYPDLVSDIDEEWGMDVNDVKKFVITPLNDRLNELGLDDCAINNIDNLDINEVKKLCNKASLTIRQNENFGSMVEHAEISVEQQKELVELLKKELSLAGGSYFNQRHVKDGFAGDIADAVSHVWNNELLNSDGNSSTLVERDYNDLNVKIQELEMSIYDGNFEQVLAKNFGSSPTSANVKKFLEENEKFNQLNSLVSDIDGTNEQIDTLIEKYNSADQTIDKSYSTYDLEKTMTTLLGLSEKQVMLVKSECKNNGIEEGVYWKTLAEQYKEQSIATKNKVLGDKSIEQRKEEITLLRKGVLGDSVNIVDRVNDYNQSQDVGAKVVKGTTVTLATIATGPAGLAAASTAAGATYFCVELSDRLSNGISDSVDLSGAEIAEIGKSALLTGTLTCLGGTVGKTVAGAVGKNISTISGGHKVGGLISKSIGQATNDSIYSIAEDMLGKNGKISGQKVLINSLTALATSVVSAGLYKNSHIASSKLLASSVDKSTYMCKETAKVSLNEYAKIAFENANSKATSEQLAWINENKELFQDVLRQMIKKQENIS